MACLLGFIVRFYLIHGSPLAMTDGASRVFELFSDSVSETHLRREIQEAQERFKTRNPDEFWTSGQWVYFSIIHYLC